MGFSKIKEKLKEFKEKTVKAYNKTVDSQANKLIASNMTIKTLFELDSYISKTKLKFNSELWKDVAKQVIFIFADTKTDFYKKILYYLPLIYTKSWTWNLPIKFVDISMDWLDLNRFKISVLPSLVFVENVRIIKIISWEENILKILKWFNLNIEKSVKWKEQIKNQQNIQTNNTQNVNNNLSNSQNQNKTSQANISTQNKINTQNLAEQAQNNNSWRINNSNNNQIQNNINTQNNNNVNNVSQINTWINLQNNNNNNVINTNTKNTNS